MWTLMISFFIGASVKKLIFGVTKGRRQLKLPSHALQDICFFLDGFHRGLYLQRFFPRYRTMTISKTRTQKTKNQKSSILVKVVTPFKVVSCTWGNLYL